ncbi:MAG: DEAD/DEAH box helicase [Parabacteroides sp.]
MFQRLLNDQTRFERLKLSGPFAKMDFLLKAHHAQPTLRARLNETRIRLKAFGDGQLAESELAHYKERDLCHLCLFIALLFEQEVPTDLAAHFPAEQLPESQEMPTADRIRLIISRWDAHYLYGQPEQDPAQEICVCYQSENPNADPSYDRSYLTAYLREGTQLNLVRPRLKEEIFYPELIIIEPDYLVDISAIASCMENYAHSPLLHLLHKLQPAANSEAILLGNFAGQLLDEELHADSETTSYTQSVKRFFQGNTLNLLATELTSNFHEQSLRQRSHIHQAIRNVLPNLVQPFDLRETIVEPTFFSELLGLQGRMDLLQLDQRVLVEQKAGKGGFPQRDPKTPVHQEKHYVQMLLYMALLRYNYHSTYVANNHELNAFLLYSRYENSLLGLGFAPTLLFEAIKLRNGIAAHELAYARGELRETLESLTADSLNERGVTGKLWEQYQRPQLEALLHPIHAATPLARAYYFRFLSFVELEQLLAKIGNAAKEGSGFAAKWQASAEEKLQTGDMYAEMTPLLPTTEGPIETVTLRYPAQEAQELSNFRPGDIVILYPYPKGHAPNATQTMVLRATIAEIGTEQISLTLRNPQGDARIFTYYKEAYWAIEHDLFDSSFTALYRGLHSFLSAPADRQALLLLQRSPRVNIQRQLKGNYGDFNELALRIKQAEELFLLIGPPGTGKTSYGLVNTLKEELLEQDTNIVLMAYTNRAVDEICGKLAAEGIDYLRIGSSLSATPAYRKQLLQTRVSDCNKLTEVHALIEQTRVFVGTTTAFNTQSALFQLKQFDLAIIDEASQLLEPHLIGLLSAHSTNGPAIRKVVLIGDHKQLPAVVQQEAEDALVTDPLLQAIGLTDCRQSLFERLLKRYRHNPAVTYLLTKQGRMHQAIAAFPNHFFYQGRLEEVPLPHQLRPLPTIPNGLNGQQQLLATHRVAFVEVPLPKESPSDKVNLIEAEMIASTVAEIYLLDPTHFDPVETVGVIVPYRNQITTIRRFLERYGIPPLRQITIDTVERYQGSQRDYILYGFTIQKKYQLNFLTNNVFEEEGQLIDRKLNVAMTRAREHLLLFGHSHLLMLNDLFRQLIDYMRTEESYFEIAPEDYISGKFMLNQ